MTNNLDTDVTFPPALEEAITEFRRWVDENYLPLEQAEKIEEPLYHYTDGRALKSIIENEQIWFTDYRHMNDPSELTHGIELARLVAHDLALDAAPQVQSFLEMFRNMFRHPNFHTNLEFFIASFSRARDDLGQWRAYADNGRGFAIGFSPRMFDVTAQPPPDRPPEFVGPVRYTTEEIRDEIVALYQAPIRRAAEILINAIDGSADLDAATRSAFMNALARELIASPIIWRCLTTKHPAYKHESEVRLVILGTPQRLQPYITTRFRGSEIVPYIPQPMPIHRDHLNILEVLVGPSAPIDAERTLRTMLNVLEVSDEVHIHRSSIPYRAL